MIINIRGTSGSGKSTLVRALMDEYKVRVPYKVRGRRQPIGYGMTEPRNGLHTPLAVIGHYETACGGCDTISSLDEIFGNVERASLQGFNVVFEGLLISADVNRVIELHRKFFYVMVIGLDRVPIEVCLDSVNERRMERMGPEKFTPVQEKNTRSKFRGVQLSMERLREANVDVRSCDRDTALTTLKEALFLQ